MMRKSEGDGEHTALSGGPEGKQETGKREDREAEHNAMCRGLERMAHLYKNKKSITTGGGNYEIVRFLLSLGRNGLREALRQRRIRKSGVDRQLPSANPAKSRDSSPECRNYVSSERIAVYTAEFGNYDDIPKPIIQPDNIDYFLITDRKSVPSGSWKVLDPADCIPAEYRERPQLANRWCKMHPHVLFPEYSASIYVDANTLIVSDLTELVNRMEEYPVAMFLHKNRTCVYREVEACLIKEKAPKEALEAERRRLKEHGVPENYGLLEATVIARRHRDPRCVELTEKWWDTFLQGAGRDQISLIDALWQMKIRPSVLGALGANLTLCDLFIVMPHQKQKGRKA